MIDVAKPGTTIEMNLEKLMDNAEKDEVNKMAVVKIDNDKNIVTVKGSRKSYYEYSYFNNIDVAYTFNGDYLTMSFIEKEKKNEIETK
jgi:hypothetical protein